MKATCSVDECENEVRARGWCWAHYRRWQKAGDVGPAETRKPPAKFCSFPGCGERHRAKGYCVVHYERWKKHGDPSIVIPSGKLAGPLLGVAGAAHPRWKGKNISYKGAHCRVLRQWGKASNYECRHCGAPAAEWAYDRLDDNAKATDEGWPYSLDPSHYMPLCSKCHRRFDPPGRWHAAKTHCPQGHPYDQENTYRHPRGDRQCRTCIRARRRKKGS